MRLFKPQMTSAEFNAALREAGFGAAESWMCPASAPASPPSMVTARSTVAPRSRGLSETRPIRARQLGTHQRPPHQNRALDHFGLFWCRNLVQNYPHEIRLRTGVNRRPKH
jgi:hypothetical protein